MKNHNLTNLTKVPLPRKNTNFKDNFESFCYCHKMFKI